VSCGWLFAALSSFAATALGPDSATSPLPLPRATDSVAAAKLGSVEIAQILSEVEKTSFDVPDRWEEELRLRRIPFAGGEGLIVRGTKMLCGGTGNCETWLFRRTNGSWLNLFGGEAPLLAGVGLRPHESNGLPDLVGTAHVSAQTRSEVVYVFDGSLYRANECYEVTEAGGKKTVKSVKCK
jgi:hypothetical protein